MHKLKQLRSTDMGGALRYFHLKGSAILQNISLTEATVNY